MLTQSLSLHSRLTQAMASTPKVLCAPARTWRKKWRAERCGVPAGMMLLTLHRCVVYQQARCFCPNGAKQNQRCIPQPVLTSWTGQDLAENAEGKRWSALVFAKRKLLVVALNYLLARCRALAFLRPDALVGFGGKLLASSQTVKVPPARAKHCM